MPKMFSGRATGHKTRGAARVQRSASGGAVKGRIPNPGGFNRTNFVTGISIMKHGTAKEKPAPKNTRVGRPHP